MAHLLAGETEKNGTSFSTLARRLGGLARIWALVRWVGGLACLWRVGAWAALARKARVARDLAGSFIASIKEFLILAGRLGTGLSFCGV